LVGLPVAVPADEPRFMAQAPEGLRSPESDRRVRGAVLGAIAAVATVVLVLMLAIVGVIPGFNASSGGGNPSPPTAPLLLLGLGGGTEITMSTPETGPIACSVTPPAACYAYSFPITSVDGTVTWNSVSVVVKDPDGIVANVTGFAIWPISGPRSDASSSIAYSPQPSESYWTPGTGGTLGGETPCSSDQTLMVYVQGIGSVRDPLTGDALHVYGVGSYSGSESVAIP
jgi:hypothetical protein